MPKASRWWNRQCAQNLHWLRLHDPRTGEPRERVPSLMGLAGELGYADTKPLHRALAPAKWENDMGIRPPRHWRRLGEVLGVPEIHADVWREVWPMERCPFRDFCRGATNPHLTWWRRLGAWFARLFGYNNRRVRPTVTGPAGGKDMLR